MGKKKREEGTCDICGQPFEAYCSYYQDHLWVDGRKHAVICHVCYDVPKVHFYDERTEVWFVRPMDPGCLHTVEEMVEDGWDKEQAVRSIKATRAAIKNARSRSK